MNREPSPEFEKPVIGYEQYRDYCDENSIAYRRVGIQDPELYRFASTDPTTEYLETSEGCIPLIVSSEYITGFDIERTKQLTGHQSLFFLTVPYEVISDGVELRNDYSDSAILVETDSSITMEAKKELPGRLYTTTGKRFNPEDFVDDRIDDKEHQTAWVALYKGSVEVQNKSHQKKTLEEAFFDDGGEIAPQNGYTLLSGETLSDYPEIIDSLWELFKDRFGWLGDNHPVSMEDTREWFDAFLTHPSTNTLIRYINGQPKCAGFYQLDISNCDWLNLERLDNLGIHQDDQRTHAFLAALAATADNMGSYSEDYVKFQCRIAALAGMEYDVSLESSNMSSQYIPRIMEYYMSTSGYAQVHIEQIKRQDYWYLA